MEDSKGETLSWRLREEVIELALHRPPANEMGLAMLVELERFVTEVETVADLASVLIIHSVLKSGFSAGGDLHELYAYALEAGATDRGSGIRPFLELSHRLFAVIDTFPLVTIAAVLACVLVAVLNSPWFATSSSPIRRRGFAFRNCVSDSSP